MGFVCFGRLQLLSGRDPQLYVHLFADLIFLRTDINTFTSWIVANQPLSGDGLVRSWSRLLQPQALVDEGAGHAALRVPWDPSLRLPHPVRRFMLNPQWA